MLLRCLDTGEAFDRVALDGLMRGSMSEGDVSHAGADNDHRGASFVEEVVLGKVPACGGAIFIPVF